MQADLWLPFQFDPVSSDGNVSFYVTGLLQPGVTVAQANAQLQAVAPEFRREFPSLSVGIALQGWTFARQHHRRRA